MAGGAGHFYADEDGNATISDINVTPLVDITLVLLIIMMVAAPLMVKQPDKSMHVDLPKAATGDETPKSTIALTLTREGKLFYNTDEVTEPVAVQRIQKDAAANKDIQAIIAADKGVPYGSVMHLIDLVKLQGVSRFALNIDATQ